MYPCPCGYYGDPVKECTCSPTLIARYQKRISGPLLDRIDIHITVPRVEFENWRATVWANRLPTSASAWYGRAKFNRLANKNRERQFFADVDGQRFVELEWVRFAMAPVIEPNREPSRFRRDGNGLRLCARKKSFAAFYTRVDDHDGPGLSIVRAIAIARDATLTAKARPQGGLSIEIHFSLIPFAMPR